MIKCPLPYMHMFVGQNFTKPCCNYAVDSDLTPSKFWESDNLLHIRDQLESNIWPDGCKLCKQAEESHQLSLRQRSLKEYGMVVDPSVEFLDVRLSNKCNFKCRTCEPIFSSSIAKESKVHNLSQFYGYDLDKNYIEHTPAITSDIINYLPTVKKLMFTGGEPTIIDEFYTILDKCIDIGKHKDISLLITTNASKITDQFIKKINQFENVHITLSIDAVGKPAEYIRSGTIWLDVDAGIKRILQTEHSVMFNTVLSAYSVPYLESLVDYIIDNERDTYGADMYICNSPLHLHPCIYDQDKRNNLISILSQCIIKFNSSNRVDDYLNAITTMTDLKTQLAVKQLDSSKFNLFTSTLDKIRDDHRNCWPNRFW